MPVCKKCGVEKPENQFEIFRNKLPSGGVTKGRRKACKTCTQKSRIRKTILAKCPSCGAVREVRKDTFTKTQGLCGKCAKKISLENNGPARAVRKGDRLKDHPAYFRWVAMKSRCNPNTNSELWKRRYSDRGIAVCDEWVSNPWGFVDWAESSGFHTDLTLDRIDNDGPYSPTNCRWVDMKTQARNKSTNSAIKLSDGRFFNSTAEAADALNTSQDRVYKALRYGWKCLGYEIHRVNSDTLSDQARNADHPGMICEAGPC